MCTSRELFIANALSRHFAWSHNILFAEDLFNNKHCCRMYKHLETGDHDIHISTDGTNGANRSTSSSTSTNSTSSKRNKEAAKKHFQTHIDIEHTVGCMH
jgi:hypothetical protein